MQVRVADNASHVTPAFVAGATAQIVNAAASRIESIVAPRGVLNPTLCGADLVVLQNQDARRGAAMVDKLLRRTTVPDAGYDARRTARPLLATARVNAPSSPTETLTLRVTAGARDADWSRDTARAGHVAIYVDKLYHSDLLVMAERPSTYVVNLAGLSPGQHDIELRDSSDVAPTQAAPVRVGDVSPTLIDGIDALVASHAPIIETRVARPGAGCALPNAASTDIPMLISPTVQRRPDGGTRISYDLLLSNEDGGVDARFAFRELGRTIDQELVYRVDLDKDGRRVDDMFQGPLHVPYAYLGRRVGERPVLALATRNNLLTTRDVVAAPRFSEAPLTPSQSRRSDRSLLISHPWTTAVMSKELVHEDKVNPDRRFFPVLDPRRYLFVDKDDAARQALAATGMLHLVLTDGRIVEYRPRVRRVTIPFPWAPPLGTALPLPRDISSDSVIGIQELAGNDDSTTFVLDSAYRARALTAPTLPVHAGVTRTDEAAAARPDASYRR